MLTDEQLAAVESEEKNIIVRAGAGSGKTTLIVERTLELLNRGAEKICIVTFSRAAAKELRDRIPDTSVQIGTFHSVILEEMRKIGERPNVLDEEEARETMRSAAMGAGVMSIVNGAPKWNKNETYWANYVSNRLDGQITKIYESLLAMRGDIDYSGIMHRGWQLAKSGTWRPQVIIVDEAQDNDLIQWQITKMLADRADCSFVVGDTNQTIHEWRGARPDIFEALCNEWATYAITETFRCPQNFVNIANKIRHINIQLRTKKMGGTLMEKGDIVSQVKMALSAYDPQDIAILCRYNRHADAIRITLNAMDIPVEEKREEEKGPVYWLLRWLSNYTSTTARQRASKALMPYAQLTKHEIFRVLHTSGSSHYVQSFLEGIGTSYGPAEVLAALDLPSGMLPEARKYASEYQNKTLEHFRLDFGSLTNSPCMAIFVGTVHSAKGLEWPCVIVDGFDGKVANEENCRLFNVAVTRAKNGLCFTSEGWKGLLNEQVRDQ